MLKNANIVTSVLLTIQGDLIRTLLVHSDGLVQSWDENPAIIVELIKILVALHPKVTDACKASTPPW
jgi:hypothetical protein